MTHGGNKIPTGINNCKKNTVAMSNQGLVRKSVNKHFSESIKEQNSQDSNNTSASFKPVFLLGAFRCSEVQQETCSEIARAVNMSGRR